LEIYEKDVIRLSRCISHFSILRRYIQIISQTHVQSRELNTELCIRAILNKKIMTIYTFNR